MEISPYISKQSAGMSYLSEISIKSPGTKSSTDIINYWHSFYAFILKTLKYSDILVNY